MPIGITVQKPTPLCPTGDHVVALAEIKTYMPKQGYGGKEPQEGLIWRFLSSKRDDDGNYYEIPVFTGMRYGNSKARLTWLLDMISPGITQAEAEVIDVEKFVGNKYRGPVKHEAKEGESTKFATFLYLEPLDAKAATQAAAEVAADPFATNELEETAEDIQAAFKAAQAEIASLKAREGKHGIGA